MIAVSSAMRDDVRAAYPDVDPARIAGDLQRHRHRRSTARIPAPTRSSGTASSAERPVVLFVGRDHAPEGDRAPARRRARDRRERAARLLRGRTRRRRRSSARRAYASSGSVRERGDVIWIEAMLPKREVIQLLSHATVFCVPVDLRAARHRQPRGDGLRGGRGRLRRRRDPRGGGRRRDRPARAGHARRGRRTRPIRRASPPTSPRA